MPFIAALLMSIGFKICPLFMQPGHPYGALQLLVYRWPLVQRGRKGWKMGVDSTAPLNPSGFHELLFRKGYRVVRVGVLGFCS